MSCTLALVQGQGPHSSEGSKGPGKQQHFRGKDNKAWKKGRPEERRQWGKHQAAGSLTSFRPEALVAGEGGKEIDLFPQTSHCEMLILFERVEQSNGSGAPEPQDSTAQPPPGPPDDTLQGSGVSPSP